MARASAERTGVDEIMVIGGEDVFREVLPQAGRIYLTEVHASPDADTWFPALGPERVARGLARGATQPAPRTTTPSASCVLERV